MIFQCFDDGVIVGGHLQFMQKWVQMRRYEICGGYKAVMKAATSMPSKWRATSVGKQIKPPRPAMGAQLTQGRDWLPDSITEDANGFHRGPPLAGRSTNPT